MNPEQLKALMAGKKKAPAPAPASPLDILDTPLHEPAPTESEPNELLEACLVQVAALEQCLLDSKPELKTAMREINDQLRQFPELVHLLSDEQIAPIYKARMQLTGVEVSVTKSKKKGKSKGLLPTGESLGDLL